MSYDLQLNEPGTDSPCALDAPHQMKGGTYAVGGTDLARLSITYNYATLLRKVLPKRVNSHAEFVGGIRSLYGRTGAESISVLLESMAMLADEPPSADYWEATEGNVRRALGCCLALARMRPDGVWEGD